MNGGAFGAGKAGAPFDPVQFIQKPQVILRITCWVFAVVVFGCVSSRGYDDGVCLYNGSNAACSFGVGVGVMGFLACIAFLALDAMFDNFSSIKTRKHVVMADMGFSGAWSFLWFVTFCFLSDQWRRSDLPEDGYGVDNLRAAIAFSFFSIFSWAGLCFFAVQRFRQGADAAFAPSYEPEHNMVPGMGGMGGGAQYKPYPDQGYPETEEGYEDPPFTANDKGPGANFQTPAY